MRLSLKQCYIGSVLLRNSKDIHWINKGLKNNLTMVSLMGYVVLSGKIQLDRQDTTLVTPISWAVCSTLSLILMLSLCEGVRQLLTGCCSLKTMQIPPLNLWWLIYYLTKKCRFSLMCRYSPPTFAARWMTWVGRYFSNTVLVCPASLKVFKNHIYTHLFVGIVE